MIPVFTEYASIRERPDLLRMLRAVLGLALLALTVTTVLGMLGAPYILPVIAPGFASDPSQAALTVFLTRVMFPYLLLVGLAAIDRKSTRLNSSHTVISYAVFCLKK